MADWSIWQRLVERHQLPNWLRIAISQTVLWAIVAIFLAIGSIVFGYSFDRNGGVEEDWDWREDRTFYGLLWQNVLQLLATFCSVVPVLRNQRTNKSPVFKVIFYSCASISILTATLAPIAYVHFSPNKPSSTSSSILNFAATIFAIIPAAQLAGRFDELAKRKYYHEEAPSTQGLLFFGGEAGGIRC
jgi:type IV secretory pathway VirB6-like protein